MVFLGGVSSSRGLYLRPPRRHSSVNPRSPARHLTFSFADVPWNRPSSTPRPHYLHHCHHHSPRAPSSLLHEFMDYGDAVSRRSNYRRFPRLNQATRSVRESDWLPGRRRRTSSPARVQIHFALSFCCSRAAAASFARICPRVSFTYCSAGACVARSCNDTPPSLPPLPIISLLS